MKLIYPALTINRRAPVNLKQGDELFFGGSSFQSSLPASFLNYFQHVIVSDIGVIIKNFRIQASVYYGGSAGLTKTEADSLQLSYGAFGTPVAIYEADAQYNYKGLSVKGLFTTIQIADAKNINRAYANNTPETMIGYYGEVGYNLFQLTKKK